MKSSARTLARLETAVWVLLYGGLLVLVLGLATRRTDPVTGCVLVVAGAVLAAAGAALIFVRSRLQDNMTDTGDTP